MIPVTTFSGKTVAVFGLGGSGLATCRALKAGGAEVIALDDDASKVAQAEAEGFTTQDLKTINWKQTAALVLSPGVPLTHPQPHWAALLAAAARVPVIGDIELFERERAAKAPGLPLVAITGTNGKSTTTALIAHILKSAGIDAQMGGNIGTPVLQLEPFADNRAYVVECSSYQIDLAPSIAPTVGILINLSEDHLDRHGTMQHYAEVKQRLVAGVSDTGAAVIGVDDKWCRAIAENVERFGKTVIRISSERELREGFFADGTRIMRAQNGKAFPFAQLSGIGSLRGVHNAQNAACACAAMATLGVDVAAIQHGLRTFPGLAHRMEEVTRRNTPSGNVLFVNDSKATNAESAARALVCFEDIFWIAGGKPKTGGIESLSEFFPRVRKAYLIGEAAEEFARTLDGKVDYEIAVTLDAAVPLAAGDAALSGLKQPTVLLSPACASFDQFPNFEKRGDYFKSLVQELP